MKAREFWIRGNDEVSIAPYPNIGFNPKIVIHVREVLPEVDAAIEKMVEALNIIYKKDERTASNQACVGCSSWLSTGRHSSDCSTILSRDALAAYKRSNEWNHLKSQKGTRLI